MKKPAAQIFISYRRSETGYVATMLADELKAQFGDNSVFMDVDNIPLGVDFRAHIGAAVAECHVLLALIGDDWLTSTLPDGTRRIDAPDDFVRIEIEAALERKIPVVPILTGGAAMPAEMELPPPLKPLAFRNAAELRPGRDLRTHLQGLLHQLTPLLSETPAHETVRVRHIPPESTTSHPRPRKSRLVISALTATVALLAAGVFFFTRRPSPPQPSVPEVVLQPRDGAAPSVPPPSPSVPPPSDTRTPPVLVVRGYYDAINSRSLSQAYGLLSADFRARKPLEQFAKVFADTSAIAIRQMREVERSNHDATVTILLQETDSDKRAWEWHGNVYLIREGEEWRIERTDLKRQ